jgi:hypothetical protein
LKHLSAHRACIHSQTSTNTSRDTFHPLKTANASVPSRSRDLFQLNSGAGMDLQTFRLEFKEVSSLQMNDNAWDPAISNQKVRATPNECDWQPVSG